jgi:hypothetical protein
MTNETIFAKFCSTYLVAARIFASVNPFAFLRLADSVRRRRVGDWHL